MSSEGSIAGVAGGASLGQYGAMSYADGVEALRTLVADLPVTTGRMFNGEGVKVHDRFFAFVGRDGELIAKLPEARVRELVANGEGAHVTMGRRTMREWVRVPAGAPWDAVVREAYEFVA